MQADHWLADQAGGVCVDPHQPPAVEAAAELLLGLAARFGWARQGGRGPVATEAADAAAAAADAGAMAEAAHRASDADQAVLCQWL